jgi:hypothetical protein
MFISLIHRSAASGCTQYYGHKIQGDRMSWAALPIIQHFENEKFYFRGSILANHLFSVRISFQFFSVTLLVSSKFFQLPCTMSLLQKYLLPLSLSLSA